MLFLLLFILAGVVVIVGMLIWSGVAWLMDMTSGRTGRPFRENISRSRHARRLCAFWIVYMFLLVFFIALAFSQALSENAGRRIGKQIGLGQQDSNSRVGVMSEITEN